MLTDISDSKIELAEARHQMKDAYRERDKAVENLEKMNSKYDAAIIRAQDAEREVNQWRTDSQQWAQRAMEAEWIIASNKPFPNIPVRRALGLLLVSMKYAMLRKLRAYA